MGYQCLISTFSDQKKYTKYINKKIKTNCKTKANIYFPQPQGCYLGVTSKHFVALTCPHSQKKKGDWSPNKFKIPLLVVHGITYPLKKYLSSLISLLSKKGPPSPSIEEGLASLHTLDHRTEDWLHSLKFLSPEFCIAWVSPWVLTGQKESKQGQDPVSPWKVLRNKKTHISKILEAYYTLQSYGVNLNLQIKKKNLV